MIARLSNVARPGARSLLTVGVNGNSYSAPAPSLAPQYNWRPSLNGQQLRLAYGAVDGIEPTIKGKLMTDTFLELSPGEADEQGRSWACLEVEAGTEGVVTAASRVEIIHTQDKDFFTKEIGRRPVCLILWKKRLPVRVEHILKYCVNYQRLPEPTAGPNFVRHLFL